MGELCLLLKIFFNKACLPFSDEEVEASVNKQSAKGHSELFTALHSFSTPGALSVAPIPHPHLRPRQITVWELQLHVLDPSLLFTNREGPHGASGMPATGQALP